MNRPILLVLVGALSSLAEGAVYYVSPSGNDVNPGTKASPWKTARRASRGTRAGDLVYFRGGNYLIDDTTYFYPKAENSGTPTAPITYTSYPDEHATFLYDVKTAHQGRHIVYIPESVHDLVFERLTFRQSEDSRAFSISGCLDQNKTCDQSQWVQGMSLRGRRITVRNCQILNTSGTGIGGAPDGLVENNTISGSYTHGFYIAAERGIWRNNVLDCGRGYFKQHCIQIQWAGTDGNQVYGNLVKNGQSSGVVFSGPIQNNHVFNNIFIGCGKKPNWGGSGAVVAFVNWKGVIGSGNKFYNNTVLGSAPKNHLLGVVNGQLVDVYNNIFHTSQPAVIGGASGFPIRNNIFFNTTGTLPANNLSSDPKLTNPAGADAAAARIQAGSPAINAGAAGAPDQDYFGKQRPNGKADIGAHEFTGSSRVPWRPSSLKVR